MFEYFFSFVNDTYELMLHVMVPACDGEILMLKLFFQTFTIHTRKPRSMAPACDLGIPDQGITFSFFIL